MVGQESGNAITDVLFGMVNPSARLPFTMARQRSDYPADILYDSEDETPQITYEESLLIDYRHFDQNDIEPRFEFGFGLSYSNFTYSELQVSSLSNSGEVSQSDNGGLWNPALSVSFGVTNANGPDGFEVSQLYLSFPEGSGEPPKVLRGFERTWLSAGQTLEVKTELTNKDLSIW